MKVYDYMCGPGDLGCKSNGFLRGSGRVSKQVDNGDNWGDYMAYKG